MVERDFAFVSRILRPTHTQSALHMCGCFDHMSTCMYVCIYACMYVYMYVCMYVCMYVYMYVCMYVCMYVYMYVCMYVRVSRISLQFGGTAVLIMVKYEPFWSWSNMSRFDHGQM